MCRFVMAMMRMLHYWDSTVGDKINFPPHALHHSITSFGSSSGRMGPYQTGDSMQTTHLLIFVSLSPSFVFELGYLYCKTQI